MTEDRLKEIIGLGVIKKEEDLGETTFGLPIHHYTLGNGKKESFSLIIGRADSHWKQKGFLLSWHGQIFPLSTALKMLSPLDTLGKTQQW